MFTPSTCEHQPIDTQTLMDEVGGHFLPGGRDSQPQYSLPTHETWNSKWYAKQPAYHY